MPWPCVWLNSFRSAQGQDCQPIGRQEGSPSRRRDVSQFGKVHRNVSVRGKRVPSEQEDSQALKAQSQAPTAL